MQEPPYVVVVGSANVDLVVPVPRHPAGGETVLGGTLTRHAGGKGANQAVAAARAGGVATVFVGAWGEDDAAAMLEGSLRSAGVDTTHVRRVDAATGTALISVSAEGENAIVVAPGANAHVGVGPEEATLLGGAAVVLAQLEVPVDTVRDVAAACGPRTRFVLNAAPSQDLPHDVWAGVDVLVVNEHEAADIAGRTDVSPEELAQDLLTRVPAVVVTLGGDGSLVATRGEPPVRVPAFTVDVVDTTGAGDTYCGVLAAELAKGAALAEAARVAAAAGALATTAPGAQGAIPTAEAVADLVASR